MEATKLPPGIFNSVLIKISLQSRRSLDVNQKACSHSWPSVTVAPCSDSNAGMPGAKVKATATPELAQKKQVVAPQSLSQVDHGKILGFGADLAEDHPGFHDAAYKLRRMDIARLAHSHQMYAIVNVASLLIAGVTFTNFHGC